MPRDDVGIFALLDVLHKKRSVVFGQPLDLKEHQYL
jgi:hypothetical protein